MVRVVLLVYHDGDAVGRVRDLRDGVDDKSVVAAAVVRGDDVEAVADVEQRGHVVFVDAVGVGGDVTGAQLVGERVQLRHALLSQRRQNGDGV